MSFMRKKKDKVPTTIDEFSAGAEELSRHFPSSRRSELIRFLTATKGDIKAASEKYARYCQWKKDIFPIERVSNLYLCSSEYI